jgi:hypothetical protein
MGVSALRRLGLTPNANADVQFLGGIGLRRRGSANWPILSVSIIPSLQIRQLCSDDRALCDIEMLTLQLL